MRKSLLTACLLFISLATIAQTILTKLPQTNGTVNTSVQVGNTMYIGGNFTKVGTIGQYGVQLDNSSKIPGGFPQPNGVVNASIPDGTGGWYIGGNFTSVGTVPRSNLAHITKDGIVDPLFAGYSFNGAVTSLKLSGNKLYVGGAFTAMGNLTGGAVLLDATSGAVLSSFPYVNGTIFSVVSDDDGGWFIGGKFTSVGGQKRVNLAKVDSDGNLSEWNPGASATVYALCFSNNKLYVGGDFTVIGGATRARLAEIDANGVATSFNGNANASVRAIVKKGDTLFVGGLFSSLGGQSRLRLGAVRISTNLATNFNPAPNHYVYALAAKGDTLFVGGQFSSISGTTARARLTSFRMSTGAATGWAPQPSSYVYALVVDAGRLYVGGIFTSISGTSRSRVAAYTIPTTGHPTIFSSWNPNVNNQVSTIAVKDGLVYLGGTFTALGPSFTTLRSKAVVVNNTTGAATTTLIETNNTVNAIGVSGNNVLFAGSFTGAGGITRNRLAALEANTGSITAWNPNMNGQVNSIEASGNIIYAGGAFTTCGSLTRNRLAAIDATTGIATSFNTSINGTSINALALKQGSGAAPSTLYVGGVFTAIAGISKTNLAAINASTGALIPTWLGTANSTVNAIAVYNNYVYVGGAFTAVAGTSRGRIAKLNATGTGTATSWNPASNSTVTTLAASENTVYAGGSFTNIGSAARNYVAALDANTGKATTWDPSANTSVNTVCFSGGKIFVGGNFTRIGGVGRNRLAAFNTVTGEVTSWNPGANGTVNSLVLGQPTEMYVGGAFTNIGGVNRNRIANFQSTYINGKWVDFGEIDPYFNPNANATVNALAFADHKYLENGVWTGRYTSTIYAGGSFTSIGGQLRSRLAAVYPSGEALPWKPNPNNVVNTLLINNDTLFIGGSFTTLGGNTRNRVAIVKVTFPFQTVTLGGNSYYTIFSKETLTSLNPNANNTVNAFTKKNDTLFIGGNFTSLGGSTRNYIGAYRLSTANLNSWYPPGGANGAVTALSTSGNTVYAGGNFTSIGGQLRNRLAGIDASTYATTGWDPNANNSITMIAAKAKEVYIGGAFTTMKAVNLTNFAGVTTCTTAVAPTLSYVAPACAGTPLKLKANSITGATYNWTGPNGFTSTAQNPVINNAGPAQTGSYTCYIVVDGCTSDITTLNVEIIGATVAASNNHACIGENLELYASSNAGATYLWTGPNGFTSTLQNPVINNITAAGAGTYNVTATFAGCSAKANTTIVTLKAEAPSITSGTTAICTGTPLVLDAGAGFTGYNWSTGEETQTITVTNAGVYSVSIIKSNGCESDPVSIEVSATDPIVISEQPVSQTKCSGENIVLNVAATGASSYQWYYNDTPLEDGANIQGSTEATLTISPAASGNTGSYYCILTNEACGSETSNTITLTINEPLAISVQPLLSQAVCPGNNASFSVTASGTNLSYQWYKGNTLLTNSGRITGATSSQMIITGVTAADEDADYYCIIQGTSDCGSSLRTISASLILNEPPATITPLPNVVACSGKVVEIEVATTGEELSYQWRKAGVNLVDGTAYSGVNLPTLTFNNISLAEAGNYDVVITNACGSTVSNTFSITVNASPVLTASTDRTICEGSPITLSATGAASYEWSPVNSTASSIIVSPASTTDYTVTGTSNGCSSTESILITVLPKPAVPEAEGAAICTNTSTALTASLGVDENGEEQTGGSFQWYNAPANGTLLSSNANYNTPVLNTTTIYYVQQTVNGCASDRLPVIVTVNPLPPTAITVSGATSFCEGGSVTLTAGVAVDYLWSNGETTRSITVNEAGTYNVELDNNGCSNVSDNIIVTVTPGNTYYRDADGDGYGNAALTTKACSAPAGYVLNSNDCNDAAATAYPGASEICGNNIDDDCDGQVDEGCNPAGALHFDGINDYVRIASPFTAFNKELTVEWSAMIDPASQIGSGISQTQENLGAPSSLVWMMHYTPGLGLQWYISDNGVWKQVTANVPAGWHRFVGVVSSSAILLYMDGQLVASAAGIVNGIQNVPSAVIHFGKDTRYATNRWMKGQIDEVRIWSRALCAAEISHNNACELTGPQDKLEGYYKFNHGFVNENNAGVATLTDHSGNNRDGLLNGFTLSGTTSNWVAGAISGTCSQFTDNVPPVAIAKNLTVNLAADGTASITTSQINNGSYDGCGTVTTSITPTALNCNNVAGVSTAGSAANFTGGYLDVAHHASLNPVNEWTLETWVKTPAVLNTQYSLIEKYDNGNTLGYLLRIAPGNRFMTWVTNHPSGGPYGLTGNTTLSADTWYHVAATFNRSTGKLMLYVNGQLDGQLSGISGLPTTIGTMPLRIGARGNDVNTRLTNGQMDEVRVWSVERTAAEIKASMKKSLSGSESGLELYYNFNEEGNKDNTPLTQANNGTVSGNVSTIISGADVGYTTPVTLTVTDASGNVSTTTGYVTVNDVTPPVKPTISAATGECSVTVTSPTTTDVCAGTITGTTNAPLTYSSQGTYTITWKFDDGNGNITTADQAVTVKDVTAPVKPVIATATGECSVTVERPTTTDNCAGEITGRTSDPLTYSSQGTYTITWTFDDGNGNITTAYQTVVVDDITAPVKPVIATATGACSVTVERPTTTDNCSGEIIGKTSDPLTYSSQGTYTITWTFDDGNGNVTTAYQTVIVDDITAPVKPVIARATGECSVTVERPTTTDNCAGEIIGTTSDPLTYSSQGTYTITWTFDDGNGNVTTAYQTVIVDDITAPVKPVIARATGECSVTVERPTTTDNCAGEIIGRTSDPLTYTAQGTYTITWTFDDGNGNVTTADQIVIVKDVTAPVKPIIATATGECSVTIERPTTTDNCSGTITGTTTDPLTYTVQGTYTITWTFDDGNGNVTTADQIVIVKDVTAPVKPVIATATGECSVTVERPTTTDNCAGEIIGRTSDPLTYSSQGTYTISWTFDDGNGNVTTAYQTVIVDDITAPVKPVIARATGECSVTVERPATTDNCSGTITGTTTDPLTYTSQGTYTITWTFHDGNGNVTTADQIVIVKDVTAPVKPVIATATGECSVTVERPTTTDNCSGTITGTTTDPLTYTVQGTYTITWTFDDGNGNVTTALQTVVVDDITAPVKPVIATATGECSVTVERPTTTDNCSGEIIGRTTDPLTYSSQGTYTIRWTFDDGNGNVTTALQTVVVDDITAPVKPVIARATGECSVTVEKPTTSDNCSGTITGTTTDPLTYGSQGTYTITWTFDDGNGNVTTAYQTVVVDDITAPVKPVIATATGECSVTVERPTTTDNCAGEIIGKTSDPLTYTVQGTYTIRWTFDDGNGNITTAYQTVVVDDISAPVKPVIATATGECSVTVERPTTTDNCAGEILGRTSDPLTYSSQGTYTITWTFDDGNGNVTTAYQTIIVDDITAPVKPVIATATGECSVTVERPTTTDNCAGEIIGTTSDPLTYSSQGTYTITWTFDDGNGNVTTADQIVIVKDVTAPVKPVIATVTGECSVTVERPTTIDNCSGTIAGTTDAPLTYTSQGTYTITWTFDDGNGNVTTADQIVVVKDVTAPVKPVIATATGECSVTVERPTTTDNCAGEITGKTSDPLTYTVQGTYTIRWTFDDGNGNITTAYQTVVIDDITAPVKPVIATATGECSVTVERPTTTDNCSGIITGTTNDPLSYTGKGNYAITWTFDDGNGNTTTAVQAVIVTDDVRPTITAPATVEVSNDPGKCAATVLSLGTPVTGDNCGVASVTNDHPSAIYPVGTTTVNWTVTDVNGNTTTTAQQVIVKDSEKPMIAGTPANITVYTGEGRSICGQAATWIAPTASDNCTANVSANATHQPGAVFPVGETTVTYTFTDAAGNESTTSFTVTVVDDTKPVITCTASPVFHCYSNTGSYTVPALVSTDNCGIGSVSYVITGATTRSGEGADASGNFSVGTSMITWTVTDIHKNVSECTTTVVINPSVSVSIADAYAVNPGGNANTVYIGYGPSSITLNAAPNGGTAPYTYLWSIGAVTQAAIVTPPQQAGTYTYTVVITDAKGCAATISKTIIVTDVRCGNKMEKVLVCQQTGSARNPWVQICIAPQAVATHLANGSTLGNCNTYARMAPALPIVKATAVKAYPNPGNGVFELQLIDFAAGKVQVQIIDNFGKIVDTRAVTVSYQREDVSFNLRHVAPGVYQVRVVSSEGVTSTKVVIAR